MQLIEIMPKVFYLAFENKKELTTTMCRAQEYYESEHDHIRGHYFDWPTFIDTFSNDKGELNYFSYWSGFNIPSNVFKNWMKDFAHDFSPKEKELIALISEHVDLKNEKFYLIATEKGKVSTIQHEIAHALYHLDDNYKEKMDGFSAQLPKDLMKTFWEKLNALGYGDNVVHDEFQAYLSTSDEPYMKERFNFGFDGIEELVGKMKEVINQCANEEQILEKINKETVLVKPKLKM